MTITEYLTNNFSARKTYGVIDFTAGYRPQVGIYPQYSNTTQIHSTHITFIFPVGKEEASYQVTGVALGEAMEFIPRTDLGRALASIRKRAIDAGMKLLNEEEVLEEIKIRRGELNTEDTDLH